MFEADFRARDQGAIKDSGLVHHMGVIPMPLPPHSPLSGMVSYSALQVFFNPHGEEHGSVQRHTEPQGVDEVYFPLSGEFAATRGGAHYLLRGDLSLGEVRNASFHLTADPASHTYLLQVTNGGAQPSIVPGFVIPGGTMHATRHIHDSPSVFLAIKVNTRETK